MAGANDSTPVTVIRPNRSWKLFDLDELIEYRDLFYFMVWRTIKVAYAQTIGGFAWAIIQPAIQVLIFTVIFGRVVGLETDGIPYLLFVTPGIIAWNYMQTAITQASTSLVVNSPMLGKIYFPRIIYPMTPILALLVDLSVSMVIWFAVMIYYQVMPTTNMLLLPVVLILLIMLPLSVGLWLSSLAIRFRDVQMVMPHMLRVLMYTAPIIYSGSVIPDEWRSVFILNPLVGIVEGFRSCLVGSPIYWDSLFASAAITAVLFVTGALYFRRMERVIVDVI